VVVLFLFYFLLSLSQQIKFKLRGLLDVQDFKIEHMFFYLLTKLSVCELKKVTLKMIVRAL